MAEQPFYSLNRWRLSGELLERPQAYFVERTARRQAQALQEALGGEIKIQKQERRDGKWVDCGIEP